MKSLQSWPWWAKTLIIVVGLAGFGYVRVRGVASDAMQSLNLIGWASFDRTYVDWNGDIGATNVRIWPWDGDPDTDAITAERFVIDTPGWGWVLQSAFSFGSPSSLIKNRALRWATKAAEKANDGSPLEDIPAMPRIHARLENVVFSDYAQQQMWQDDVHGLASGSVFEGEGCGQDLYWTEGELVDAMELRSPGVNFELDISATGTESIAMRVALDAPGRSSWRYEANWQAPHDGNLVLIDWEQAKLRDQQWTVKDDGFVAARNAYCAQRDHLTEVQFIDQHIDYLQRRLLNWGLFANTAMVEQYRRFVSSAGNTLTWSAKPLDPVSLDKLYRFSATDMLWMLNANLRVNDDTAAPFTLRVVNAVPYPETEDIESASQIRQIVAQTSATLPAEVQSAAVVAAMATPSPAVPTMIVSAESTLIGVDGQVPTADKPVIEDVSFDDLAYMIGERVIIRTTMNSTREGELKVFNRAGIRVSLRNRPGMELEIPRSTVAAVQVVWTKSQTAAASAAAGSR
ncbi:MAG TPA: hypothetical protein PLQ74_12445 [Pseudomonadota bacterium]|nr:hypothetical protein [Rhodanobacteraceae bacterium]MBP9155017.1 hypothetical protein [Xanthomonadales bacterium]HQW82664.1 hypothetical protein [Pseudomonadota bacterium]